MTSNDLYDFAVSRGCSDDFLRILRLNPTIPNYMIWDCVDFGKKVYFIGNSNQTGINKNSLGYILGVGPINSETGLSDGNLEIAFEFTSYNRTPFVLVYPLQYTDVKFSLNN